MTRVRGFTLLELLVATAILALIATFSYAGLDRLLDQRAQHRAVAARLAALQRAVLLVERDLAAMDARGAREASRGSPEPALVAGLGDGFLARFTRSGRPNPLLEARSSLQRVALQVEDRRLVRYAWPAPDPGPGVAPRRQVLLDGVDGLALRFLDARGEWREQWPAADPPPGAPVLPRAVELTLSVDGHGSIVRLIELPEGA